MGTLSDFKTLYKTDSLIERYEAINIENVAGLNSLGKLPELKERLSSAMGLYGEIEGAINDLSPVLGQLESNATAMRAKITDAYDTQAEPVMVDGISAPDYEAMIDAAWEEHNTACDLIVELDTMKTNLNNWISTWSPTADQLEAAQRPSPPVIIVEEVTPPPTPPENTAFRLSKISIPDITIISIDASNRAGSLRVDASSKRSVFEYYAQPNFDKNIALMQLRTILGQIDDILANEEIDLLIDKLGTTGANLSKARQEIKAATEGANAVASAAAGNDMEAA